MVTQKNKNEQNTRTCKCKCKCTKTVSLVIIIVMTSSFFFVELIVGNLTNSNSLVADAFHMLSDLIALIIGLTAVRFSKRQSSRKNTFGWARAEILGSLVNSVFLLALCFTIVIEAVKRYLKPEALENVILMLGVGGGGLALNIISLFIFAIQQCQENREEKRKLAQRKRFDKEDDVCDKENGDEKKEEKVKKSANMNMYAVFLNALGDSLGSVAVMISGLLVKFAPGGEKAQWKLYVDPTLSLIIATIITISTVPLLKKSSMILLETVPSSCNMEEIHELIRNVRGVVDVHHFHIWSLNTDKFYASAHIRVAGEADEENDWKTVDQVKRLLHKKNIHSTTIQLEHDDASLDSCEGAGCKPKSINLSKENNINNVEETKTNEDNKNKSSEPHTPHASFEKLPSNESNENNMETKLDPNEIKHLLEK